MFAGLSDHDIPLSVVTPLTVILIADTPQKYRPSFANISATCGAET